jgi:CubicO group peptidase (beta-lactamase class C family)
VLRAPSTDITLRHLLLHASGIGDGSHPLIESWKQDRPATATSPSESGIVNHFSYPLLFVPGTGYAYGASIYWTELLLSRVTSLPIGGATEVHVLAPLNLTSSAVRRHDIARLTGRLLQMVERGAGGTIVDAKDHVAQSAVSSAEDLGAVFAALLAAEPTFLPGDSIDFLFKGQFAAGGDAMRQLQRETEGYGAPAGVPGDMPSPPVNWSAAGLVVERELPLVHMPAGSVTWDGMPNVVWVMNRARGLGMVFATQLLPTGDKQTVELAQEFFRGAWAAF